MSHNLLQGEKLDGPPPPYIAAVCDPRYSSSVDSEKTTRVALEDRISQIFRKIWSGLYEADKGMNQRGDVQDNTQIGRLRSLAQGAGMRSLSAFLDEEFDSFRSPLSHASHHGMFSLRLFEHTSISHLECAVEILKKYEQEVAILHKLESILQQNKPGLHELGSPDNSAMSELECLTLSRGMAKRITEHNSRAEALSYVICKEAKIFPQTLHEPIGRSVYQMVVHDQIDTILDLRAVGFH